MDQQTRFRTALAALSASAEMKNRKLTKEDVAGFLQDMELNEEQYQLVYAYLASKKIEVEGVQMPTLPSEEIPYSEEEQIFLNQYQKELKYIKKQPEEKLAALYEQAADGVDSAKKALTEHYMDRVLEIAKGYAHQGLMIQDLVQEGNLGLMIPARECGMRIRGDFGLNLYNSAAMDAAQELELRSACLSFEMTLPQVRDVSKAVPAELIAYGRLPLMLTENCIIRNRTGQCACHQGLTKLTDKTGAEFPVIRDGNTCRSVLLNGKKLSWLDRQQDLSRLGLWAVRLYFTTENPREVDMTLASYQDPTPFDPGACTRGLYLRGLD
jgi:putative protease